MTTTIEENSRSCHFVPSSLVATAVAVCRSTVPLFRKAAVVVTWKFSDLSFAIEVVRVDRRWIDCDVCYNGDMFWSSGTRCYDAQL